MKRISLFLILILFSLVPGFSQDAAAGLEGRVVDENNEPIEFANVTLFSLPDSSMIKAGYSEEDGSFHFSNLQPGNDYIIISFVGFDTYISPAIEITENKVQILEQVRMSPFITELGEVVVASTKPIVEVKPGKTIFNVQGSVNSTGNNALELLRKAPGVIVDNNERLMVAGKTGVKVYIDGKQSILTGADLSNYLKTLQASQIEAIEIITQPSSRYEADGNAGIINIRLIKDKSMGTNAVISLSHNQSIHGATDANINLNSRTEKFNVFGNVNYATGTSSNYNFFERTTSDLYTVQSNTGLSSWDNFSLRSGLDYTSGKNSTIGFLFDGMMNNELSENATSSTLYPAPGAPPSELLYGTNDVNQMRNNYNFNGNYRFDNRTGTVLNVDLDYGSFINEGSSYQPNYYYDPVSNIQTDTRIFSSDTRTEIDIQTLKVDYEKAIWGGSVGTGFKLSHVGTDNSYDFYDIVDGEPIPNVDRTNTFDYTENINAGYINYSRQWKKVGLQMGIRAEQTDSKGELTSLKPGSSENVTQDYLDVFPSGSLSYQLNEKNGFSLSYSRRIDRPSYQDLNPFEFKLDELTYQKGNPFLRPQYSNSVQLSHTFNYTLNTNLAYSHTSDLMAELTDTASNGAVFLTTENVANQDVYSLSVSYPFALSKTWNVFATGGVNHTQNKADFGDGKIIDIQATTFNMYGQNTFLLPKDFSIEVSGWYSSPGIWGGNFATNAIWALDAGIAKKIWDNRGQIKISVSDIFDSQGWSGENNFGGLAVKANGGWESRRLKLNITYNLGNKDIEGSRKRSTGLEDESKRIKTE